MIVGKLLVHMCLCYQAEFDSGKWLTSNVSVKVHEDLFGSACISKYFCLVRTVYIPIINTWKGGWYMYLLSKIESEDFQCLKTVCLLPQLGCWSLWEYCLLCIKCVLTTIWLKYKKWVFQRSLYLVYFIRRHCQGPRRTLVFKSWVDQIGNCCTLLPMEMCRCCILTHQLEPIVPRFFWVEAHPVPFDSVQHMLLNHSKSHLLRSHTCRSARGAAHRRTT